MDNDVQKGCVAFKNFSNAQRKDAYETRAKLNVYCTVEETHFAKFNEAYERYFPVESPARIFLYVPSWPGPFDIEIDCVAVV